MASGQSSLVRRRLACDRCHSHKLRCPRPQGSGDGSCARCVKAGAVCIFSPSLRGVRMPPHKPTLNDTEGLVGNIENGVSLPTYDDVGNLFDNVAMDWSMADAGLFDDHGLHSFDSMNDTNDQGSYLNDSSILNLDGRNGLSSSSILSQNQFSNETNAQERDETQTFLDDPSRRPRSSPHFLGYSVDGTSLQSPNLLLDLVQLSVRLDAQARRTLPFSIHDSSTEQAPTSDRGHLAPDEVRSQDNQITPNGDGASNRPSVFEEPFHLTDSLLDLYPRLMHDVEERKWMEKNIFDGEGGSLDRLDHSLLYLLFSCHHRLIDIWGSVFIHSTTYTRKYSSRARHLAAHCPKMHLGSYVPSESSTVIPMELMVAQELASHLINRVRNLVTAIDAEALPRSSDTAAPASPEATVNATHHATMIAAKALCERAMDMHARIVVIKHRVEEAIAKQARITR